MPTGSGLGDQIHDFEPGIKASGLFWTIPIDSGSIDVSPGSGRARFAIENLAITDYHDFGNAISENPTTKPGHASFEVIWAGRGDRQKVRDTTFDFAGEFVSGPMTITFTVSQDGGPVYTSDAAGQSNPGPPGVGHERNGVFF